ncbi:cathelicidin antimicrobial peptide isoform X2 [Meriones unguiculatus]|uniref:cathelicidin antimicrobial peptide isoform X2 n=1 Tax=Meriones unguiculatus TaxID=10047 RepID=UPI00293F3CD0|nr:cathelicidin antimicrobial peptide isoform X2 [Meriones unguiculatus]
MQTQRGISSLQWWLSLLLPLGLGLPPAISQTLSYREAVVRAVDDFNQQSLDTNLYRLLNLDSQPQGDEDPATPKYVRFRVKETLVKQCMGTVSLNQDTDAFDINCNEPGAQPRRFKKIAKKVALLGELLQKGGAKIGKKLEKIGQKIKNFFQKPELETKK